MNKVYPDARSALAGLLKDGMTIMAGGFGLCGIPDALILAIRDSGDPPCGHVATLIGQHLAQVEQDIAELTRTHDILIDLQRRAAAIKPADCAEPEICSILTTA